MSDLILAHRGEVLLAFGGQSDRDYLSSTRTLSGALLYQTRLSAPWGDLQLLFSIRELPPGPGAGGLLGCRHIVAGALYRFLPDVPARTETD